MTHRISIDTSIKYQTFENFGTSSCWWSQNIDNEDTAKKIAEYLYNDESGLGLDIYRYNIGSGEADNPNTRIVEKARRAESFYVFDEASQKYIYDFTRDANARRMLDKAVENGASGIILFCNSPHYSMTVSGHASGGLEPSQSNLPAENYQAFVDYVLTIADWFVSQGYPIIAVSPINEPQWQWGGENVKQEGCHYTIDETVKVLELFATNMKARQSPYALRGPESGKMSKGNVDYINQFCKSKILREYCDTYCGHAYWMDEKGDDKYKLGAYLKFRYPDMKYEMSEWCELPMTIDPNTVDSGIRMANTMISDLNYMYAVSWQSWTAVNGDGLIELNGNNIHLFYRYYAFKQFSSFIKPGMRRVRVNDNYLSNSELTSTAFSDGAKTIFVVINNSENDEVIQLCDNNDYIEKYVTDKTLKCKKVYSGNIEKEQVLNGKSITTFVLE